MELEARVRRQLTGWYGEAVAGWEHLATYRIAHGQPKQPPGFRARHRLGPRRPQGVYVCGDWLESASVNGALESGRRAAEAVLQEAKAPSPNTRGSRFEAKGSPSSSSSPRE